MATAHGHLHLLQRLRSKSFPWNERTCALASQKYLSVLQWARESGCPWDYEVYTWVDDTEHVEIAS